MWLRLEPSAARVSPFLHPQPSKQKRKFSSFFKSLVIELDKELYGPDNHLVEVRAGLGLGSTGYRNHAAQQAINMELSKQESRSSAGNNQEAEQAGITLLSRQ